VKLNGGTVTAYDVDAASVDGAIVQAGKRLFVRFRCV